MKKRLIAIALTLALFGGAQIFAVSPACQPLSMKSGFINSLFGDWNQVISNPNANTTKTNPSAPATAKTGNTNAATSVPKATATQPIAYNNGKIVVTNSCDSVQSILEQIQSQAKSQGYCPSTNLLKNLLDRIQSGNKGATPSAPVTTPSAPSTAAPTTKAPSTTQPATKAPSTKAPSTTTTAPKETTKQPGNTTTPPTNLSYEEQVVALVNKERAANGLRPLTLSSKLSDVARAKSEDMRKNNYFAHQSPTYGSPFDMMKAFGISYRTAGENIAKGYRTPEAVVEGWMNSPGHRANILNASFTTIGVGYVADGNYWTQMFIG